MTAYTWKNGASGNWGTAGDWLGGTVANSAIADVTIAGTGSKVTIASGISYTVDSVTLGTGSAALTIAGTLDFAGSSDALLLQTGVLDVTGTLIGAHISRTGGTLTLSDATLDGVSYSGTLDVFGYGNVLYVENGLTGTGGVIDLNSPSYGYESLQILDSETLNGQTIVTGETYGTGDGGGVIVDEDGTLTLGAQAVVSQAANTESYGGGGIGGVVINQGQIDIAGGSFQIGGYFPYLGSIATSFTNASSGTISIAGVLDIDTTAFTNAGKISLASGGTLDVQSSLALSQLGSIVGGSAGTVEVDGTLNLSGGTITLGSSFPNLFINGGVLEDGTLSVQSSGTVTIDDGTLSGVSNSSTLDVFGYGNVLYVENGLTGTGGVIDLNSPSYGYESLQILDSETLNGQTIVTGETYGTGDGGGVIVDEDGTLTLGAQAVVSQAANTESYGGGGIGGAVINQGQIDIAGGSFQIGGDFNYLGSIATSFTNASAGTISVGGAVDIDTTAFTNSGQISLASGGTLDVQSSLALSQLGSIVGGSGAAVEVDGTLNLSGGTITVGLSNSFPNLFINGGLLEDATLSVQSSGTVTIDDGTLDGVSYSGTLDVFGFVNVLYVENGLTASGGVIDLNSPSYGYESLQFLDSETLNGQTIVTGETYGNGYPGGVIVDEDGTLTLGAQAMISQAANTESYGGGGIGGAVINQGQIDIAGGTFQIGGYFPYLGSIATSFTNASAGTISVGSGAVLDIISNTFDNLGLVETSGTVIIAPTKFTNEPGGTLTGGTYSVGSGGTLMLPHAITTDAADIILGGVGAVVEGGTTTLEKSLVSIASAGVLQVLGGRSYVTTGAITDAGSLGLGGGTFSAGGLTVAAGGTVGGFGTLKAAVADAGMINAAGGTLVVTGSVSGAGGMLINASSDLVLGAGAASGTSITFGGTSADLTLDAPGSVASTLVSLAPSDVIDLVSLAASSASISGGDLIVSLTAGGTLAYTLANANTLDRISTASDGHGGTDVNVFGEAQAGAITPATVNLGQQHASAVLTQAYTVTNTAAFGASSENLDAVFGGVTGALTAAGSIAGLAPGASNSTALAGTLASTTAGLVSGTGTIDLYTDGTGVPGDGLGTLAIGTQIVTLAGTFYNFATASAAAPDPLNFGNIHAGATASQLLTISNQAAPGIYSENLDASFASSSTGLTGSGNVSELAAGGTSSGTLAVTLSSATAGVFAGASTLALVSDGTGIDTLANTTLAPQTIAATATVYAYAGPSLASTIITLGNAHVGGTDDAALTIANITTDAADTEGLDASFSGTSGAGTDLGSLVLLAAGDTDSSSLLVGISDTAAGSYSGAATLSLVSDGSLTSGLGTTGLGSDTVEVSGAVYALATPTFASTIINLGVIHAGDAGTAALTLTDATTDAAYTEALDAGFTGASGSITANGTVYLLGAGDTDSSDLVLTLATGTSGTVSGAATVSLTSDGAGTSNLGTTSLGGETVTLTGTVDNYASISVAHLSGKGTLTSTLANNYTLNLGSVLEGAAALSANLEVLNSATGLSDLLGGSFTVKTANSKFTNTGIGTFSGLGAGAADTSPIIKLSTGTAGTETEVLVIDSAGSNASGYNGTLSPVTLTITGIVADVFTLTSGVDDFVGGAGNDLFIAGPGDLSAGDILNGGAGTNSLSLSGGGTFDMTQPATLTSIQQVLATEAAGAAAQTVYLRSGFTGTLTAASGAAGSGITIYGNADSAKIKLGNGNDTVFVGSKTEVISSGSGNSVFNVTSASAGAKIGAGGGANTLAVSGGGTVTMGSSITGVNTVTLNDGGVAGTSFIANTDAKLVIYGGAGADTITLGAATQSVDAGSGTTVVKGVIGDAKATITSNSLGTTTLDLTTGGTGTLNANDTNLIVKLSTATNLTLSKMGFITIDGSAGNDMLTALAANQTLTGGLGTDTLTGYAGFGDLFLDTAAGLNGDTIKNFGGSDLVDLTNINAASVTSLGWTPVGSGGKLTVSDGTNSTTINFSGTYSAASFTFGSDGAVGTYVHFL